MNRELDRNAVTGDKGVGGINMGEEIKGRVEDRGEGVLDIARRGKGEEKRNKERRKRE